MLYELIAVIALVAPMSLGAAYALRKDVSAFWQTLLIGLGPILDSAFVWWLMDWQEMGFVSTWSMTIAAGIVSTMLIQPLFSPRRLLVFRLATEQIRRKPRQAALMMAGLLIASAIITSSLVVGDSLESTMTSEIEAKWGDTDILIYGQDQRTGIPTDLQSNLSNIFGTELLAAGIADDWSHGIESSATITQANGKADPSVAWLAYDGWQGITINQALADSIETKAGDRVELAWHIVTTTGLERQTTQVQIDKILPMTGQGAMAGTRSPAIFTSLDLAQELQEMESAVNRVRISLKPGLIASEEIDGINSILDGLILAEDSNFEITKEGDALSIGQSAGLGRLDESFMASWRENSSDLLADGNAMEILQIPLVHIEHGQHILSLPDDRIDKILISEDGDWYVAGGAVSFQIDRGGKSHGWKVPDGGLINDISLGNSSIIIAHSNGLTEVPEDRNDNIIHHVKGQEILISSTPTNSDYSLPSTVFSLEHIISDEGEFLAIKGLLGNQVLQLEGEIWVETNFSGEWLFDDGGILFGSSSGWSTFDGTNSPEGWTGLAGGLLLAPNGTLYRFSNSGITFVAIPNQGCDNRAFAYDFTLICTTSNGVLLDTNGTLSPRLPLTVDVGSIGEMPQLLLATDNGLSPNEGQIFLSSRLEVLESNTNLHLNGLIPWAYGDEIATILNIGGNMAQIDAPGLDELEQIIVGLVNMSDGESLTAASKGERSMIVISNGDNEAILSWLDGIAGVETMNLQILPIKEEAIKASAEGAGVLSSMFLVFGTFTIGAGVLLVLTIVIMLAEQRRTDEAIIRALGMKRSDMRALALTEGMLTSAMAAFAGGIFGLFLAWIIGLAFGQVFESVGASGLDFSFSIESMLIGMATGFIVAMTTLWSTAMWTSRLNIVQALRGINPNLSKGIPWWAILGLIILLGGGILSGLAIFAIDSTSSLRFALWHIMGACLVMSLVPIITYIAPLIFGKNIRNSGKNTMAAIGFGLILWAKFSGDFTPVAKGIKPDEITFVILGLLEVFAGVLILTGIAPRIAAWVGRKRFITTRFGPVVNVSLAHPAAAPLRTAIIMGMFSLTVFSVVVLAGYSDQFESHSTGYVDDASGEFEILLSSSRQSPLNLSEDPFDWNLANASAEDIDAIGRVNRAVIWVDDGQDSIGYILRGVDQGFVNHGGLPLEDWDHGLGDTAEKAWISMEANENIVFVDSSFALVDPNTGESIAGITLSIGESISLIDISNPGNSREVMVGGILSQSSNLFSTGVWMSGNIVEEQFGGVVTRIYVSTPDGVDSAKLEQDLSDDLAKDGVHSSVFEVEILKLLGLIFAILLIFQAYLALGLIVGIAGIGVVTYRSVSERSGQIGMLRALGFRKKMVMSGMILEVSWVALLGMLNGAIVALAFHTALHKSFWKEQGVELILPWTTVIWLLVGGWILVLAATAYPVSKVTKITPANALASLD